MRTADIGTIIHGTMREQDLLEAFSDELEALVQANAEHWCSDARRAQRDAFIALVWDVRELNDQSEAYDDDDSSACLEELFEALDYFAPHGAYFGAHPGDGADYGFWPNEDDGEDEAAHNPEASAFLGGCKCGCQEDV